jgi:hypothetical protein
LVESPGLLRYRMISIVRLLMVRWSCPSDRLEESFVAEPIHPLERGVFDGLDVAPRAAPMGSSPDLCVVDSRSEAPRFYGSSGFAILLRVHERHIEVAPIAPNLGDLKSDGRDEPQSAGAVWKRSHGPCPALHLTV